MNYNKWAILYSNLVTKEFAYKYALLTTNDIWIVRYEFETKLLGITY